MILEGEEKESIKEVVEPADEGELLLVRRVLIGFERIKEQPKDDSLPPKVETTLIPTASLMYNPRASTPSTHGQE